MAGGPPSVVELDVLDTVAHVVLERRVADGHPLLTPLQTLLKDGLHRVDGPARHVPVELWFGFGDVTLWKTGPMVRKQACSVSHLHTDGHLLMFLCTEPGDPLGQHASV